ncbi:DUF6875 domain-containing protein [Actinophytocola oryzae]|uniref:DUF6875 domain-containing protein n=1 Tax=Actinophytocola oryzae TaxID=502181 RepID=A0A4R7V7M4_9PSEU|nr:hypothetical protein [Actinophytocola oryzae]TDV43716.1 hypothetical protein CLV71_115179 [Actinophytocola oryzae]
MSAPETSAAVASVIPRSLIRADAATMHFDRYPQYEAGMRWVDEWVTQPHPDLGRPGAVCPQLAPAIRAQTVWLVALTVAGYTPAHAVGAGTVLMEVFDDLAAGPDRSSTALLGFFPELPDEHAATLIDGGHRELRTAFVERGLMLGEFHARSTVGGVHNRALRVMRCPAPMFAVRVMTPHDVVFADQPALTPAERVAFLRACERHIGARLNPTTRADLGARLQTAHEALPGRR